LRVLDGFGHGHCAHTTNRKGVKGRERDGARPLRWKLTPRI
jgi:hypothetical protein